MADTTHALTLGDRSIRELDGLFSLNDLHRASGGETKHQPALFLRLDSTRALMAELGNSTEMQSFGNSPNSESLQPKGTDLYLSLKTVPGRNGGTYACRELVIAYAAWISAAFHLKVIRIFLAASAPTALPDNASITAAQAGELATLIAERFPDGRERPYAWSRFNNHFRIARYRELPAARFDEARQYIGQMECKAPALPAPVHQAKHAANVVAAAIQTAVFNSLMDGGSDWQRERWLLSFNPADDAPRVSRVEPSAFVLPIERFAEGVGDVVLVDDHVLTSIASVCLNRLHYRAEQAARRANQKQPLRVAFEGVAA